MGALAADEITAAFSCARGSQAIVEPPRADRPGVAHRWWESLRKPETRVKLGYAALIGAGTVAFLAIAGKRVGAASTTLPTRPAAGRRLNTASALLAAAALADMAIEHYRGSFHNPVMYLPLGVAAQTLAAGLHGAAADDGGGNGKRAISHQVALATGVAGAGFHFYNIVKRPGGFGWLNLFYAAPLGAPIALSLAGMLGDLAERVRDGRTEIAGMPTDRLVARLVAVGLVGTSAEAALLHFRGAYHNPAMFIPIVAPPVAAALLTRATLSPPLSNAAARGALRLLTVVGLTGAAFHAYGVQRNMGGWRNWSQNLLNGPPLPAPPAFTALAIAGLAALNLIEERQ